MARKLHSPTSLTQFPSLSPEESSKPFSFMHFFKRNDIEKDLSTKVHPVAEESVANETATGWKESLDNSPQNISEWSSSLSLTSESQNSKLDSLPSSYFGEIGDCGEIPNRNMTSVLKIVKNLVEGKKMGLQNYKDSDFKQYWMPDSNCKECYECGSKFTALRRRHHCRVCGQIFCRNCCNQGIPGNIIGYSGDLRVCSYCYKMVSTCMQSIVSDSEEQEDLQSSSNNVQPSFSTQSTSEGTSGQHTNTYSSRRKSSVMGFREEEIAKANRSSLVMADFCCDTDYREINAFETNPTHLDSTCLSDLYYQMVHSRNGIIMKINKPQSSIKATQGSDIVNWLMVHNATASRDDAVAIGQAFLNAQFLECYISHVNKFTDSDMLFKCHMMQSECSQIESSSENQEGMEPLWVKEIQNVHESCLSKEESLEDSREVAVTQKFQSRSRIPSSSSSFYLDLDLRESWVKVSKPKTQSVVDQDIDSNTENHSMKISAGISGGDSVVHLDVKYLNEGMHDIFAENLLKAFNANLQNNMSSKLCPDCPIQSRDDLERERKVTFKELNSHYKVHETSLLRQLLESNGLTSSWCDIVLPLIHNTIETVHPDVKNDADRMDIRQYVQFKKIPGGNKCECSIVHGVVFSKTVAHRKMRQNVSQPMILLLSSPIAYQRTEKKLSSLDPLLMQEFEYLKNSIGKLTVCKPDVLLVEKSVSRLAQEMLLAFGITVALNVKPSVMERVSRCTQASIVSTVDEHLGKPQLGMCQSFNVKTFSLPAGKMKTLMFLDGCPENLGCTLLLRGGSTNELKKVKQIIQFMLFGTYNWEMERSFLTDEFAVPLSSVSRNITDMDDNENGTEVDVIVSPEEDSTVGCLCECGSGDVRKIFWNSNLSSSENGINFNNRSKSKTDDNSRRLETRCIDDFSDPLHSYLQSENDLVFCDTSSLKVSALPANNTFRKFLDEVILCCSLNIKFSLPFLETETGKNCPLRKYFPTEIYWSPYFSKENETKILQSKKFNFDDECEPVEQNISANIEILPHHVLTSYKLTNISETDVDLLLSDYRARGCTIKYLCPHQQSLKGSEKKATNCIQTDEKEDNNSFEDCQFLDRKVDALDPYNHQKLAVLFCSYSCISNNAPSYCVNPWVVEMDFYGSNDITFGGFLEKYCFRTSYVCPSQTCDTPMTEHVRKFVHGSGCVHILLRELSTGVQTNANILMWSWCHKCKEVSPVVPMSQNTWSFSFAKYLELRFHASSYRRRTKSNTCSHSLHHDHYQYFAYKNVVAIFEYNPIVVWEISFPSLSINMLDEELSISAVVDEIKHLAVKGTEIYSMVLEKLVAFKVQYEGSCFEDIIASMIAIQKSEMSTFREKMEQIQLRLTTSPELDTMTNIVQDSKKEKELSTSLKIEDQVTLLKYHIAEAVQLWNNRIQDFVSSRRKEERQPQKSTLSSKITESDELSYVSNTDDHIAVLRNERSEIPSKICDCIYSTEIAVNKIEAPNSLEKVNSVSNQTMLNVETNDFHPPNENILHKFSWLDCSVPSQRFSGNSKELVLRTSLTRARSEPSNLSHMAKQPNGLLEKFSSSTSISSFTYGVTCGIYAGLMVPEPEDNESYVVCHNDHILEQHSVDCPSRGHERSRSEGHQNLVDSFSRASQERSSEENIKRDKKTVKTFISQLLSNSDISLIQCPFPASQHIILPKGDREKIPVIVYDDEPSSIIAYTLSSADYEQQLQDLRVNITSLLSSAPKDSQTHTPSPLMKRRQNSKLFTENAASTDGPLNANAESLSNEILDLNGCSNQDYDKGGIKPGAKASNFHLEIQFNDSNARFYCRVYYAEQFRKLRCLVFSEGEERYIRSLSHCIPWVARGGKSGSTFCKTADDRFILKQMQKLELQSFLELAPSYFHYINKACLEQKPTLFAKIVGVYRIGYKNTATNSASKMDLLVMENLFYGRNITRKYDLKGSVRNRLVNTSGLQEDDIVLMDENLLKITCDNPLYIRPHSKTVLKLAIDNDTQFLAKQLVMDYSLLVGLDEEKNELVVGIIDYIRTFTWDKKVEMFVKSSVILGGHGKLPTVIHPESYLMRFREAMDGYFLWVPDQWFKLGKGVDETNECKF